MNNTADKKYQIKIENFEGPFDLLLYLVKNSKINIGDISISAITMQFLQFLNDRLAPDIEESSLFIFMVSSLMNIKSKTLLPQEIDIEEDSHDDRDVYVRNLIEYQKYKKAAEVMKGEIEEEKILMRKETQLTIDFKDNENWEEISIVDLIIAFSKVAKDVDKSVFKAIELEEISIDDKINEIMDYLSDNTTLPFSLLFSPDCSKNVLIITFLALLELVKMKKIYILQHKLFGTIKLTKREKKAFEQK
jgi:segregation and condensation protein A